VIEKIKVFHHPVIKRSPDGELVKGVEKVMTL
jgi:hypothetical protein